LDLDNRAGRTRPLGEHRNVAIESGVVYVINEDAKKGIRLVVGVWLESGIDLDDECGCDGGEQTGLFIWSEYA